MTDVITSPYLNLIAYNLDEGVSCNKISDSLKVVFNEKIREKHIRSFKDMFFPNYECVRGKSFIFKSKSELSDINLPFNQKDILDNLLDSISLKLGVKLNNQVSKDEDIKAVDSQLLMNLLNYAIKSKEVKQIPLLEDYVDPTKEDMIFEGVEYDE